MSDQKIRFASRNASGFIKDVKSEAQAYFDKTGLSKHADAGMVLKTIIILLVTFGSYGMIISGAFSLMQMWGTRFCNGCRSRWNRFFVLPMMRCTEPILLKTGSTSFLATDSIFWAQTATCGRLHTM